MSTRKPTFGSVIKYYQPIPAEIPYYGWAEHINSKKPEPPIPFFHTDTSVCKHCKTGLTCMMCEACTKCREAVLSSLQQLQKTDIKLEEDRIYHVYAWPMHQVCARHTAYRNESSYLSEFRNCRICAYLLRMLAMKWNLI